MRILVTGGAGFLGAHLCETLLEEGHTVICLDNFYTGFKRNIEGIETHPRFTCITCDITKPLSRFDVDQIYNLACPASPPHYQADPLNTLKTNVLGMINVLDLAKSVGARVLQASTSEVYGDPQEHPQKETYWGNVNPIGVRSCYDEGKRCAETLCFDYRRFHSVDVRVVRIFNTYGPKMDPEDGRVVSNFITQALRGEDITIYGDGKQTRSFCYYSDLIRGFKVMMQSEGMEGGPINLGNPAEFTILELAQRVIDLTGSKAKLVFKPLPSDDPIKRKPDITAAADFLGWSPQISLDEGLRKTIPYFQSFIRR